MLIHIPLFHCILIPILVSRHEYTAINITIVGSRFYQHNYFFYPPASNLFCAENPNPEKGKSNVYGSGVCGVNGGFKSFDAFSTASYEKDGTMISLKGAGSYKDFGE